MQRPLTRRLAALACALGCSGALAASASAQIKFGPCGKSNDWACASLAVPLDPSGATPGTVKLSIRRHRAAVGEATTAIVALAGGPGQPAIPFAEDFAELLGPIAATRDLIVFDQRGLGTSGPLSCHAFERLASEPPGQRIAECGEQLGPARAFYTSADTVADIEAIRQAGGYQKLVLYGTSYGTKVAEEYAERYPQHVEALVLDSVVPVDGPEPLGIPTFQAVAGVIRELCTQGMCAGITPEPLADLSELIARLRRRPLGGSVYDGRGRRHNTTLDEVGLLRVLEAGDLNPALRALLPAAVRSALHRDPDPLLRLQALAEGLIPNLPEAEAASASSEEPDEALFVDTSCEEENFPWQRSASASTRLGEATSYLRAQPAADFAPFDAATALQASLIEDCAEWPDASPAPPVQGPLPNVPTLILSGEQDLRTPTSNAREVAALIPDAQLLLVPFTGHSVIGSDLTDCTAKAVAAFFSGAAVQACASTDVLRPTPVTPVSLAAIHPPHGLGGKAGRTLVAVLDTLLDLNRQEIAATIQADAQLPSGSSFGGLHGGYAKLTTSAAILKGLSFVPGVNLTGTFPVKDGRFQTATITISGRAAATGTVRIGSGSTRVTGTLGGHRFDLDLAKVKVSSAGSGEWPAAPILLSRLGDLRRRAGALPAALAELP